MNTLIDSKGEVTTIRLHRPEVRNALNEALITELTRAFGALPPSTRVAVLAGDGPAFCAGADAEWMKRSKSFSREENERDAAALARLLTAIDECPVPVIARVSGAALGGGAGLVAACDIAVADEAAQFGFPEVRLGLVPAVISTFVLARIGARAARRYFVTGERFAAPQALALGLIHEVTGSDALDAKVEAIAREILQGAPKAVGAAKRLIRDVAGLPRDRAIEETIRVISGIRVSPEAQEGLGAFLEKEEAQLAMKVLVANRGEIACRILRTLKEMSIPSVAVHTDADADSPHAQLADESAALGAPDRYLSEEALIGAARKTGATAIHPGYGFLSQSASFARACEAAGLTFIGPTAESMTSLGDKRGSRSTAQRLGIPVVPGAQEVDHLSAAEETAEKLGYPVLLKAAGGGGGRGMRLIRSRAEFQEAHEAARREAKAAFADDRLILEKFLSPARHVEVQVLGDGREAVALGERECSLQRRYQKVIEEGPAIQVAAETRRAMSEAAVRLAREVGYRSAGTVEFLVSSDGSFHFLEVNTRLQVEHPVTEMVSGMDIVRAQIEVAQGGPLPAPVPPRGHAIEARLNAEDAYHGFVPQSGPILMLHWPQRPGLRIDAGVREGQTIGTHYDSLLAKIIAWGSDREQARRRLIEALRETALLGITTNQPFLIQLLESEPFKRGETYTTTLESLAWPEAPVPPEIASAARRWLSSRPSHANGSPSVPSPWDSLGRFRMGS